MNRADRTGSLETREPEKTPLIDMVFLLLVFFFVNLSMQTYHSKQRQQTQLEEDVKRSFLRVPHPAEYDNARVILIEILDASIVSTRNRLAAARARILNCSQSSGCAVPQIPSPGNGPGQQRFWVALTPLDQVEKAISNWNPCPACADLQAARRIFPLPWSDADGMASILQVRLAAGSASAMAPPKEIHVRVPASFPAAELLRCFYRLAQTVPGIDRDHIYIRALEERM